MDRREPPYSEEPRETVPLRAVFEEQAAFVCRTLRRHGVREADLDDMLQEVFLVVHRNLHEYVDRGRMRAWLYSICTRVAHGQRRKVVRRREAPESDGTEREVAPAQLQHLEDQQSLRLGYQLLEALPPQEREVFVLYEVEDMTMPEIVQVLGCPLQTGYSRLNRARERILAQLAKAQSRKAGGA
jgi:RNA polymerase sigma-70 factor (ECF subfamily)